MSAHSPHPFSPMRLFLPLIAAGCALLASCSSNGLSNSKQFASKSLAGIKNTFNRDTIGGYTRGDIANLRMRDLNPLAGTPQLVQVRQSTLQEIPRERRGFLSWFGRKPVNYTPPTLPDGTLAFDGGLLPSKDGAGPATLDFATLASSGRSSSDPATELEDEDNFSIE